MEESVTFYDSQANPHLAVYASTLSLCQLKSWKQSFLKIAGWVLGRHCVKCKSKMLLHTPGAVPEHLWASED